MESWIMIFALIAIAIPNMCIIVNNYNKSSKISRAEKDIDSLEIKLRTLRQSIQCAQEEQYALNQNLAKIRHIVAEETELKKLNERNVKVYRRKYQQDDTLKLG